MRLARALSSAPSLLQRSRCVSDEEARAVGARDSKTLSPKRREEIYAEIAARFQVATRILTPGEIDARPRASLNTCIARAHAAVVADLSPEMAILDACDVDERLQEDRGRVPHHEVQDPLGPRG